MAKRIADKFVDQRVVLDDDEFFECTFTRCRVVYRGGGKAYLVGCRFEDGCTFHLEDAAQRTLAFLRGMYHHLGPAGLRLVENTFDEIRQPDPEPEELPGGGGAAGGAPATGHAPAIPAASE